MKVKVGINTLELVKEDKLNKGEYNIHECEFEFDEIYNGLIKKAVFSNKEHAYLVDIQNGSVIIPYEIFENTEDFAIGAYGYETDGDQLVLRYSPSPVYLHIDEGSYRDSYDNYKVPTADVIEQLERQIQEALEEIEGYNGRLTAVEEKLETIETGAEVNIIEDIKVNGTSLEITDKSVNVSVPTKTSDLNNDSGYITEDVNNLTYYTLGTATGSSIELSINSSTYVVTLSLKNSAGNILNTQTIDLPLESVVVNGSYDSVNKKIILTLQNGNTIDIPVGDLVAGLQSEITNENKLSSDLVDDTNNTHKFVSEADKTNWNNKVGTTDYATANTGGVVKINNTYGLELDSSSILRAKTITYSNYNSFSSNGAISKGTLENVITGKNLETANNKVVSISSSSTDTQYPSAKLLYDKLEAINTELYTDKETSQEDVEQATLNNTTQAPLKTTLKGNTSQYTTTGKNLFNGNAVSTTTPANWGVSFENNVLTIEHKNTYSTGTPTLDLGVLPSGTYVLSGTLGDRITLNRNGSYSTILASGDTFSSNGTDSISLTFGNTQATTQTYKNVQVELGSTATDYEEYTGGIASPNPDYPQVIHTITGDNTIKICGKNLAYMKDGSYTYSYNTGIITNNKFILNTSGSSGAYGYFSFANGYTQQWAPEGAGVQGINDMNITPNGGNYIFTINTSSSMSSNIGFYVWTSTNRSFTTRIDENTTKTLPISLNDNEHIKDYGIWTNNNNVFRNYELTLQLEKGTTATTYEPYNGDTYELDLGVENLININNSESGGIDSSGIEIEGDTLWRANTFIEVKPNTTYTLSRKIFSDSTPRFIRLYEYNSSQTFISPRTQSNTDNLTITTGANTKYLKWTIYEEGASLTLDIVKTWELQLEEGSKANSYSPFGQTPIKMRGIGTYEDYFVRGTGKNLAQYIAGWIRSDGVFVSSGDDSFYFPVIKGETYIFNTSGNRTLSAIYNDIPTHGASCISDTYITLTKNTPFQASATGYMVIYANTPTSQAVINDFIAVKGNEVGIYEPYGAKDKWCKYNAIGKWKIPNNVGGFNNENNWYYMGLSNFTNIITNFNEGYCNYLKLNLTNFASDTTLIGFSRLSNTHLLIRNTACLNQSDYRTWFANNDIYVYLPYATPYLSLIENETLISQLDKVEKAMSYQGQTNVSQVNNDKPFILDITAFKNTIAGKIAGLEYENELLKEKIDELEEE